MANGAEVRSYGSVFNEMAEAYDLERPAYPDALVDRACAVAGLTRGACVLEIGCGSGQLTRGLVARGLRVTAVEPGDRLVALARDRLGREGEVEFLSMRLEDARLPEAHYRAAFSATAIHWIDPDVSWRKLADALVDGGTLALISHLGLEDRTGGDDHQALRTVRARIAPRLADEWPIYRDLDGMRAGVAERKENVSEAWAWLGSYDVGRGYAAELFEDTQLVAIPSLVEQTADALNAVLATMSFYRRLSPRQRNALIVENEALEQRLGRPIRSSTVACLLTARRVPRA